MLKKWNTTRFLYPLYIVISMSMSSSCNCYYLSSYLQSPEHQGARLDQAASAPARGLRGWQQHAEESLLARSAAAWCASAPQRASETELKERAGNEDIELQ